MPVRKRRTAGQVSMQIQPPKDIQDANLREFLDSVYYSNTALQAEVKTLREIAQKQEQQLADRPSTTTPGPRSVATRLVSGGGGVAGPLSPWQRLGAVVSLLFGDDRVVLPQKDDSTNPTLSYGDEDTGDYEESDDVLVTSIAGTATWRRTATAMGAHTTTRAALLNEANSSTNPTVVNDASEPGTGLAKPAASQVSLTANSVEGFRTTETSGLINLGHRGPNGSESEWHVNTEELTGLSGATASTTSLIPAGAYEVHVVVRVTTLITSGDGGTDFDIGDGTDVNAWGAAIAFAAGTTTDSADWTVGPFAILAGGDVTLTCNAGTFNAGAVRVVAFYKLADGPTS